MLAAGEECALTDFVNKIPDHEFDMEHRGGNGEIFRMRQEIQLAEEDDKLFAKKD